MVGVFPALREALDDSEDELSALASGAVGGGGLALAVLGGLNGRTCAERVIIKTGREKVYNQVVVQCFDTQRKSRTHNLIDPCEFSSGQFGPGGGSWWGHQGSSSQWGCRSVQCWHYTHKHTHTQIRGGWKVIFWLQKSCLFILPTSNRKHFVVGVTEQKQSASVPIKKAGGRTKSSLKKTKAEVTTCCHKWLQQKMLSGCCHHGWMSR